MDSIRYLLTMGSDVGGRLGFSRSHVSSRRSISKVEQSLTYPQIVNRLRKDLDYFADNLPRLDPREGEDVAGLVVTIDE